MTGRNLPQPIGYLGGAVVRSHVWGLGKITPYCLGRTAALKDSAAKHGKSNDIDRICMTALPR